MKAKILLIDDDQLVIQTLSRLLTMKGYDVVCVNSAVEAISQAAVKDFDLVISDIRMPGENGVVTLEKIKKIYEERRVYCSFIFITGYAEEDTPAHAVRLGVNKFLFKPFDNDEFLKSIQEELDLVLKERALRGPHLEIPEVPVRKYWIDRVKIRRAVITGIGSVAPSGIGKKAYWTGLKEGLNCVKEISFFDASKFPSKVAAEIRNFEPSLFIEDRGEIKRMARSSHLAVAAAKLALEDSGISSAESHEMSVIVGSSTSGVEYLLPEAYAFARGGLSKVRPYVGIAGFVGSISSEVSRFIGAKGSSYTLSTGCTSATDAMGYAFRQIQYGYGDLIVTGGADACVSDGILAAFCRLGAVSTRTHDLLKSSRPFNKDRDGFVIAEGGWLFVLEELEHALKRKAKIYAEIIGYGATCDAWHMARPHPSGEGVIGAIQGCLQDAAIRPDEVDLFEAYGNSTPINDSYETSVIKKVFGAHAYKLAVPSVKSMIGHPIGAAGSSQVAAALLALDEGFVHPTINYEVPDPDCDLDYVPNSGRTGKFKVALCNSLAFGGKNACLALRAFND